MVLFVASRAGRLEVVQVLRSAFAPVLDVVAVEGVRVGGRQIFFDLAGAAWLFAESTAPFEDFMSTHAHIFASQKLAAVF